MKYLKLFFSLILITLFFFSCSKDDNPIQPDNQLMKLNESELQKVLDNYVANTAGVLGVIQKVEIPGYEPWTGASGYFDISKTTKLDGNELFSIGSITKTFTATMILQLYEEGIIELGIPIINYLPQDYKNVLTDIPFGDRATIYQALCHKTGFYNYIWNWDHFLAPIFTNPGKHWTPMEKLLIVKNYGTSDFAPGESYHYSNTNYLLLGIILEFLDQKIYANTLKDRITSKIELDETFYHGDVIGDNFENFAHGYDDELGRKYDTREFNLSSSYAEGGIISTTGDLIKFFKALVNCELYSDPNTFEIMLNESDNYEYGLGIIVKNNPIWGKYYEHGGSMLGQKSIIQYVVKNNLIIASCLTQDGTVEYNDPEEVVDLMLNKLNELGIG